MAFGRDGCEDMAVYRIAVELATGFVLAEEEAVREDHFLEKSGYVRSGDILIRAC